MHWLAGINLIEAFNVYLMLAFVVSIVVRYRQYRTILDFILTLPQRWPKLLQLAHQHRMLFLTWPTFLPIASTFGLMVANSVASNSIWDHAKVTPGELGRRWIALAIILVLAAAMLFLDFKATFDIGQFDQAALQRDLDRAEYWLKSWMSPVVHVVTFGYISPHKMVNEEVRKALADAALVMNQTMWSWSVQLGVRLAFGLSLWLAWAFGSGGSVP